MKHFLIWIFLFFFAMSGFAQNLNIKGQITDTSGESIIGVNVKVKGKDTGTITDIDGNYHLQAAPNDILVVSYIGFITQEVPVKNRTVVDIRLIEDVKALDEVVVVGYGTQRKADLTGAVIRADIKTLKRSPNSNVLQSLQGNVPGLNIGQVTNSGGTPSMSPSGTKLLCNHRGDAYWSVFDVKTHTEKKIDTALVNGYARTSDIEFLDENHILTYGESVFMGEDENYETYCVNLDTLKIEKKYNGTGEINMKWDYRYDKKTKTLKFLDLVNGTSATIPDVSTTGQIVAAKGDYVIFGDIDMEDDTFYLVNLFKKSWKKLTFQKSLERIWKCIL